MKGDRTEVTGQGRRATSAGAGRARRERSVQGAVTVSVVTLACSTGMNRPTRNDEMGSNYLK